MRVSKGRACAWGSTKARYFRKPSTSRVPEYPGAAKLISVSPPPKCQANEAVSFTASLAWHFGGGDTEISFAAPGYSGTRDVLGFLKYLALVEPQAQALPLETL